MKNSMFVSCITALMGAASAFAGGTIVDRDASFTLSGAPFVLYGNNVSFIANPGEASQINWWTWYYKTANSEGKHTIGDWKAPLEHYSGNTATLTFIDAGPPSEKFDATITIVLIDGDAPVQSRLECTARFTNTSGTTNAYKFYNVMGFPGPATVWYSDRAMPLVKKILAPNYLHPELSPPPNGPYLTLYATPPSASAIKPSQQFRQSYPPGEFTPGSPLDLPINSIIVGTSGSADGASAYQWNCTLAPGESVEYKVVLGLNQSATAPATCYANCDGSQDSPTLTVTDFQCFLDRFRAADYAANCDGVTTTPYLSASDFTCFLNKFRVGCP